MTVAEVERTRVSEQARIDAAKTIEDRRSLGQFATPPELAREIARATLPLLEGRTSLDMLEPSAGTGAFISAFLGEPSTGVRMVEAVEFDPAFFEAGQRLWSGFPVGYRNGDFTKAEPFRTFDLVVANPPYVRHHGLDAAEKRRLQAAVLAETGLSISGLAGLYCHFLLLSLKWMKPGALAVWLVPTEWMSVNYGKALRTFFAERVRLVRVHRFDADDVRFSDALVSSCVIWFRKEPAGDYVLFTGGSDLEKPSRAESIPVGQLQISAKWPPAPSSRAPSPDNPRLRDFFDIRRGIATGDNSFFVLPEAETARRGLPHIFLKPILPSPRHLATDRVVADRNGVPANTSRLFLFDCTGRDSASFPPSVRDYLAEGFPSTATKKLCAARPRWYDQEQRLPAPLLCTYMGRGDGVGAPVRFILNESNAIATNSFLLLYPKAALRRRFRDHPEDRETVWNLLRGIPVSEFRRAGRCYGGGLQKMEPKELGDLDCSTLRQWLDGVTGDHYKEDETGQLLLAMEPAEQYDAGSSGKRVFRRLGPRMEDRAKRP